MLREPGNLKNVKHKGNVSLPGLINTKETEGCGEDHSRDSDIAADSPDGFVDTPVSSLGGPGIGMPE